MIARFALFAAALGFLALTYASKDGSQDAALYVGDGPGDFTTVQSGIDAVYAHDMPRTIQLQPKTYSENIHVRCKQITINGNGAVIESASGLSVVGQVCVAHNTDTVCDCEAAE